MLLRPVQPAAESVAATRSIQEERGTTSSQRSHPRFAIREEEAEFWDTHDFTDYWDELEPANLKAGPNVASSILVSLDGDSLSQIYLHADAEGVEAENLVRTWILERLHDAGASSGG